MARVARCFILIGVNVLVLHSTPQTFNEDIVICTSPVIHAYPAAGCLKKFSKLGTGKMASLVAVHYIRHRLSEYNGCRVNYKTDLKTVTDPPVYNIT